MFRESDGCWRRVKILQHIIKLDILLKVRETIHRILKHAQCAACHLKRLEQKSSHSTNVNEREMITQSNKLANS